MRLRLAALIVAALSGLALVVATGAVVSTLVVEQAEAQQSDAARRRELRKQKKAGPEIRDAAAQPTVPPAAAPAAPTQSPQDAAKPGREKVEADVSTRSIKVTSGFTGTEIIVFGSVDNSRQPSAEAGYYDVAVVIEGAALPLIARKKSNVAGLWVNTYAARFESVPSYYAIASTRPIEEIAEASVLEQNAIGLDYVRLSPTAKSAIETPPPDLKAFKEAVVRIKQKEGLFIKEDYAVAFIGRSLFRSSIALPANVPVGPLSARVYLFREGELLSSFVTRVRLEREGVELWLYQFAMAQPALYGVFAVVVAVGAGLLASAGFRRGPA